MNEVEDSKTKPLSDVYKLIDAKKFKQAYPFLLDIKRVADSGNAVAQYYLGLLLVSNEENSEGGKYLRLSVEQNYLPAIKACLFGKITSGFKNFTDASLTLLRKLMEAKDVNAMAAYGWIKLLIRLETFQAATRYIDFDVVQAKYFYRDCREAFMLLYDAAQKGNTLSLYMLAEIYGAGLSCTIRLRHKEIIRNCNEQIISSNKDHAQELLVRGANAGDIVCLAILAGENYSLAEKLRILEMAKAKYDDLNWRLMNAYLSIYDHRITYKAHYGDFVIRCDRPIALQMWEMETDSIIKEWRFTSIGGYAIHLSNEEWDYIVGKTKEVPSRYKGIKPSALMQSGVTGILENDLLPNFLTADYKRFALEIKEEKAEEIRKERESSPEYRKKQRELAEREEARQESIKRAKERKDAILGCGCLLAIIALAGFLVWWWMEGFTMAGLSSIGTQIKNALCGASGGVALGAWAKIGGVLIALLVACKLIKGKKGEAQPSTKKRWKFVVLGLLFGFLGAHLLYAKRWFLFLLLWAGLITGGSMSGDTKKPVSETPEMSVVQTEQNDTKTKEQGSPISGIGFGVWALLWIGGTLFIKKDGKGNRM